MEVYRSPDGHVAKYVHMDGSETSIKTTPVQEYGGSYGSVTNKFNIFVSFSVGCKVGCKFCYLTTKKCPYAKLEAVDIVDNIIMALTNEVKERPELKEQYAKISWMGMGDALEDTQKMYEATVYLIFKILMADLAKGIDGVDIATTMPITSPKTQGVLKTLSEALYDLEHMGKALNPERDYLGSNRHPVRVFYSLHSADNKTRRSLIPRTVDLLKSVYELKEINDLPVTLVFHHMFFDGINDSEGEVNKLIDFMIRFPENELRLLRFNQCEGTEYKESPKFDSLVQRLFDVGVNMKIQSSPGSEVKAACGQFLLSKIKGVTDEEG